MNQFSPVVLRFDSLPSTNIEAARQASAGAAEGLCVVAAEQTAGRGRLQRHWASPKDAGLYFSIVLRPRIAQAAWPMLTLMAAVAVHDALLESCSLRTDIKWPNDILANEKKLCGILAETVETPAGRAVIVGIGVNLNKASLPLELAEIATSVAGETGTAADRELLLASLVRGLSRYYEQLKRPDGPETIVRAWCARSSFAAGKHVEISAGDEKFSGITRGLETDGSLMVETAGGELRKVRAGDVAALRTA